MTHDLRKKFPLSALSVAAAMPLLMLAGAAHSAGNGVDRNQSRQSMSQSVKNFYAWTPAVSAANCPAGKSWQVPANGGVAFCAIPAGEPGDSGGGGSNIASWDGGWDEAPADDDDDACAPGVSSDDDGPAGDDGGSGDGGSGDGGSGDGGSGDGGGGDGGGGDAG